MDEFDVEVVGAKQENTKPSTGQRIAQAVRWLVKPRLYVWLALGLVAFVLFVGTPHLMITYKCYKSGGKCYRFTECNYYGVQGWRQGLPENGRCSYMRVFPVRWRANRATSNIQNLFQTDTSKFLSWISGPNNGHQC